MGGEEKSKKGSEAPIVKFFLGKMTPEERQAWHERANIKRIDTMARKKKAMADAKAKAVELLPSLLAEEMLLLENDSYTPSNTVLEKIRALLDNPKMTLEVLRRKQFRSLSDKGWQKLTAFLFKDHISSADDLGLQILEQRQEEILRLEKTIKMLKKEQKIIKKDKKKKGLPQVTPSSLLELILDAERDLRNYRLDVNKNIYKTNLDAGKIKSSTSVHIHTTIPRPEVKDVTPKKTLDELISGN